MMDRAVTEQDLRLPEFRGADVRDLEFRKDGKIVRKDRWERGIHRIRAIVLPDAPEFEIDELVQRVQELQDAAASDADWINDVIRDVAELPDRTSPDDQPEMMMVTRDELREILEARSRSKA